MKQLYSTIALLLVFIFSSCSDYLDTVPGDQYDDNAVWSNSSLVESFVYKIYLGIPYPYQWYMSASLVDEAVPIQNDGVTTRVLTSTMTPDDQGAFVSNWATCMENWWWKSVYTNIRACNLFFSKIDNVEFTDAAKKQQLIGEVHFLRGYFYYLLMAQYGGVPLVNKVINIGDDYNIPRNTFEETVNFIVDDLDAAVSDDKLTEQTDKTRATVGAAYALKSRVLLYAASDLYHSNASWANGYAHPELIGYVNGDREALYKAAKAAAEKVMTLGYDLYKGSSNPSVNFQQLFLQMSSPEQIFITQYDKQNFPYYATDWVAWVCGTPSYGGFALNQVTANLADAFENADGTSFNFQMQKANPYADRDPRFYATILYNGASWYTNSWGAVSPATIDITSTDNNNGNTTGYYIRKFISPSENDYYYGSRQPEPYIQIRYAEVLLNYAEACLGLGDEPSARSAMNKIRERAGMPDVPETETGAALLARYRNERRVELAWEGDRFFDVRRWMIASEAYVPARGVKLEGGSYKEFDFEERAWNNSHYLIPISRTEIQKNTALIQNPIYQ
ncbi:RagB/SusD family nutrient uptake outer membrane protein [uncultured Bacteroides sp.]|uniref:RagB/SusD family nutrient uptake outer membrane protein n=1 Tax=uncultured Bacteroides sp. TaxID=162156 RepID=UPI002AA8805A|nr:RagB/SusD family nutrient uptake outer membrane protein [uncultured Bacteroides sp.]